MARMKPLKGLKGCDWPYKYRISILTGQTIFITNGKIVSTFSLANISPSKTLPQAIVRVWYSTNSGL